MVVAGPVCISTTAMTTATTNDTNAAADHGMHAQTHLIYVIVIHLCNMILYHTVNYRLY